MQNGSLAECIDDRGWEHATMGYGPKRAPRLKEVVTVCDMGRMLKIDYLEFEEYPPINGRRQLWEAKRFRELQPPMDVEVSELILLPEKEKLKPALGV